MCAYHLTCVFVYPEMDYLDFSEEEIEQQLAALGYQNIPKERLREFKRGGMYSPIVTHA